MKHFAENIINQGGAPVAGASVAIFFTGTQNQPIIYSDDGITPKSNPVITDSLGRFDFFVADGRYDLAVTGPTLLSFTLSNIEIADLTEAQTADAIWDTEAIRFANQTSIPGTPPAGNVNIYTKSLDKRLYYKDDTGTEIGPLVPGGTTSPVNSPSPFVFNTDMEFKGLNPWVDIRAFGARAVNPNVAPAVPGITANCINGQPNVTLSQASTFVNGDGVVLYQCGAPNGMSTPGAPVVTPSVANGGTGTGFVATAATGSTTFNYQIVARNTNQGLTAASPTGSTTVGSPLGATTVNIASMSRSGSTVTVTTTSPHPFSVGCNATSGCGEVYIGAGNGLSDATFYGWYSVFSAADATHFTYVGPVTSAQGAPTAATGGTATTWVSNHLTWNPVTGANQYYIYSDRNSPGTFSLVGVSNPSTATNADLQWDDYGSPMMDNFAFPFFVPATAPSSPANNSLYTTVLSGAGTTTLTLANAPNNTVNAQTILVDAGIGLLAALQTGGTAFIPLTANSATLNFVINSYVKAQFPFATSQLMQQGDLYLNDTIEISAAGSGGTGNSWFGNVFPTSGGGQGPASFENTPHIGINGAHPGLLFSNAQFGLHVAGLTFGTAVQNGLMAILAEGGFNQTFEWIAFNGGFNQNDYMSMGLFLRGTAGQGNTNVILDKVGFAPGGGQTGASHTPTFLCKGCGKVSIPNSYSVHRGMVINSGDLTFGIGGVAYINGGGTPLVTSVNTGNDILVGRTQLDTIAHPCLAALVATGSSALPTATFFSGGGCAASSAGTLGNTPGVTGAFANISGLNDPVFSTPLIGNAQSLQVFQPGSFITNSAQHFNTYLDVDPTHSAFIRGTRMAAPTCAVSAGGSLAVGSYSFTVAPAWQSGVDLQSLPSAVCTTTSGNQTITVNWTPASGNPSGYNVYINNALFRVNTGPGSNCANTGPNPFLPGASTSSWVISQPLTSCGVLPVSIATGGPTMLMPGTLGIAAPALTLAGNALTGVTGTGGLIVEATSPSLGTPTLNSPTINGASSGTGVQGTDSKLLTAGSISGTGVTLCTDANGGATTAGCTSSVPIQVFSSTALSGDVSVTANTPTTVLSKSTTMPGTGCPCRAQLNYNGWWNTASSGSGVSFWFSDGTNTWAQASGGQTNGASGAAAPVSINGFSPVTYSNGQNVTFSVLTEGTLSYTAKAAGLSGGPNSALQVAVLSSN